MPNHARLSAGDVIVLWNKRVLLGVSVIKEITVTQIAKDVYSCPRCRRADFKARKTRSPIYLCACGAGFDQPVAAAKTVTAYRSLHANAWVDLAGALTGSTLRSLCDSPGSQLSMRPVRWEKLRSALGSAGYAVPTAIVENTCRWETEANDWLNAADAARSEPVVK